MQQVGGGGIEAARKVEEHKELRSYIWGLILALALTLVPFGLVRRLALPHYWLLCAIGAFALVQIIVHLHFFLHIGLRQKREILYLILFSTLLLFIMVAGSLWIMASLSVRMALPVQP